MVRTMKHYPSFLMHGEEATGSLSLTRRSFLAVGALSGLSALKSIQELLREDEPTAIAIKPVQDLPEMPSETVTEHVPTMEEYEGFRLALGQPFALTRETEDGKTERVNTAINDDGLSLQVDHRVFRLQKVIHKETELTAKQIKELLGDQCVDGISIQQGLVLHAHSGDLQMPTESIGTIVWGLRDAEKNRQPQTFDTVSIVLKGRNKAMRIMQEILKIPENGTCSASFMELPAIPSIGELAQGND